MLLAVLLFSAGGMAGHAADRWPHWEDLEVTGYQLYVKNFDGLTAICSSGAYWTDGRTTRLLTAGHCAVDESVRYAVSQDGLNFVEVRILARGWKKKEGKSLSYRLFLAGPPNVRSHDNPDVDYRAGDWAILEMTGARKVLAFGDSLVLQRGDALYAIGFPIGGPSVAAVGIVGNVKYDAPGTPWDRYIAANIPGKPGSSGTPVVNVAGQIVGLLVAGAGDNLHLLTPISLIQQKIPCLAEPVCAFFEKNQ